jgi:hypothetical protein
MKSTDALLQIPFEAYRYSDSGPSKITCRFPLPAHS